MSDEPADELLAATHRALCRHGYADLTLRHIAAESDRSKATIHYHYHGKDELFAAFLDYLYERYTEAASSVDGTPGREQLHSLLELVLDDGAHAGPGFGTALLEVRAQAPYDETVRHHLRRFDEFLVDRLEAVIEDGIECGEFDDAVDPGRAAKRLATLVEGARARGVVADRPADERYRAVEEYVELLSTDGARSAATEAGR
jgi:AcrR family transcriptional regulator